MSSGGNSGFPFLPFAALKLTNSEGQSVILSILSSCQSSVLNPARTRARHTSPRFARSCSKSAVPRHPAPATAGHPPVPRLIRANFRSQNRPPRPSVAGQCFGQACQKHPFHNTASRGLAKNKIGFPNTFSFRRTAVDPAVRNKAASTQFRPCSPAPNPPHNLRPLGFGEYVRHLEAGVYYWKRRDCQAAPKLKTSG